MKRCRILSITLLALVLTVCLFFPNQVQAKAKKKSTFNITIPTEAYNEDTINHSFTDTVVTKTKEKGKNTIITCDKKKTKAYLKEARSEFNKFVKSLKKKGCINDMILSKDFKELSVYGEFIDMSEDDSTTLLAYYIMIPYMQLLNGTKYKDLDLYIKTYDADGNLLEEGSLKDMIEN